MRVPDYSTGMKTIADAGSYFTEHRSNIQTGAYIGLAICLSTALGLAMLICTPDFK